MYGWIHGALEDWVQSGFGAEAWQSILGITQCGVQAEGFCRNVHYSDDSLFQLVRSATVILNLDCNHVVFSVGKHFVHYLERHGYSTTLRSQGSTFLEWIQNVYEPHRLLRSRFPKAMFPVFWSEIKEIDGSKTTVIVHFLSKRKDLFVPLFKGIVTEAAELFFNAEIDMEFIADEILPDTSEYHAWFLLNTESNDIVAPKVAKADEADPPVEAATLLQCPFHRNLPSSAVENSTPSVSVAPIENTLSPEVGLSGTVFKRLFPFHIVLDSSLHILQLGNKLQDLIDTKWCIPNVMNRPVQENFEILVPKFNMWSWELLRKLAHSPIEIALLTKLCKCSRSPNSVEPTSTNVNSPSNSSLDLITVRFRGEVVLLDGADSNKIALCISPDITHMGDLADLRLRLSDLPCHSYQADMLLIDEHLKTETNYTLTLKEISEELDRETKRTAKSLQMKRHFVRYVSHEIRTPLNIAILGLRFMEYVLAKQQTEASNDNMLSHCNMNEDENDEEGLPVVVNEVKSAVEIAVEILNDLLLYEKVDNSGFFELSPEYYDVHAIIHESVKLFRIQAKGANAKFEVNDSLILRAENDGTLQLPCQFGCDFRHNFKKSPLSVSPALSSSITDNASCVSSAHHCENDVDAIDEDEDKESIIVKVDKSKVQQVLRNLFSNAIKFTRPERGVQLSYAVFGSPELLLEYQQQQKKQQQQQQNCANSTLLEYTKSSVESSSPDSNFVHFAEIIPNFPPYFVRIAIRDEGVGISEHDQQTLFHEFIQLKAEKLQNGQGSGLGLWIASAIMQLHRGRIGVMSRGEGNGSTFCIDLPICVEGGEENNLEGEEMHQFEQNHATDVPPEQPLQLPILRNFEDSSSSLSTTEEKFHPDLPPIPTSQLFHMTPSCQAVPIITLNGGHLSRKTTPTSTEVSSSGNAAASATIATATGAASRSNSVRARTPRPQHSHRNRNTTLLPPLDAPRLDTVRVLIVDDAASNRKMVRRLFQTKFRHLDDAENGKVAVEKYVQSIIDSQLASQEQQQHPSTAIGLVLMDLLMPVMDGVEATRQIKQAAKDHGVDVLIFGVTGQGVTEDVRVFKAAGADEVFMKPLDFNKLLACLEVSYLFA